MVGSFFRDDGPDSLSTGVLGIVGVIGMVGVVGIIGVVGVTCRVNVDC